LKNIFITGGAGYIGSHCAISLINNNYTPIIIDDFSNSQKTVINQLKKITNKKIIFYDLNISNKKKLSSLFAKHKCDAVIHCAGFKAVGESVKKPIYYFDNNIGSTLSLLECMQNHRIHKLIFSSSATIYNDYQPLPYKESSKIGDTQNPYGTSKYVIERILMDLAKFDKKWSIRIARYFNPISNHSSGLIKEHPKGIPNNLIPYITMVAQKKISSLKVFGKNYQTKDGTGIRDYIHVMDLADAHVAMLKKNKMKKGLKIYNLGTGKGISVLDAIKSFEKEIGISIPYKFVKRREGDSATSYCSSLKAHKELKWKSKYDFNQAMKDIKKTIS
jgi:UDP-glucose 4-epimerase